MMKLVALGCVWPVAQSVVPETMRAVRATQDTCSAPDFECLNIREVETPIAERGQALVRVAAASVNPSDYKVLESRGGDTEAIGSDVAGIVVECDGCSLLKAGDKVWSSLGFAGGSLAEYVAADESAFGTAPQSLNATATASIPEIGITGISVLKAGGAPWTGRSNLTVVVTSGAGGTGFIGIQLAKAYGAHHVVAAASTSNFEFLRSIGADTLVDYHDQDLFDFLPDNSVDIVYDNYGSEGTGDRAMRTIRPGGAYLLLPHGGCFGNKSQAWPCVAAHPKEGVANINVDTAPDFTGALKQQNLDMLKAWIEAGAIKPRVMQEFSLEETREAYATVAAGHVVGKVVIEIRAQEGTRSPLATPLMATVSTVAAVGLLLIACSVVAKRRLRRSTRDPLSGGPPGGEASLQPIMGS